MNGWVGFGKIPHDLGMILALFTCLGKAEYLMICSDDNLLASEESDCLVISRSATRFVDIDVLHHTIVNMFRDFFSPLASD